MATQKRKGVGAGVTGLMGGKPESFAQTTTTAATSTTKETRKPVPPASRIPGKPAVRKLTVDVPESVHDAYEDLYFELRRKHRKLKRVQYAPLVIRFGLDRERIENALTA